ncbi:MAG: hypothetical protein SFY66_16535 [Oculatellaceae cyanobacterium bins.114]|nr:hypothetical protein [Oculatellaceae cyanobacterium bins.114]
MRVTKRLHGSGTEDVGGGFKSASAMQGSSPARIIVPVTASPSSDPIDDEDSTALYAPSVIAPIHKPKHGKNRAKAVAIAEARLNRLSEELLELADELRYLNPLMADALDAAWQSTDEALEILAEPHAW